VAQIGASAGQQATLNNREGGYGLVKMPSVKSAHSRDLLRDDWSGRQCRYMNVSSGKQAGRAGKGGVRCARHGDEPDRSSNGRWPGEVKRWRRKASSGEPVGQLAKGFKTRNETQTSDRFILEGEGEEEGIIGSSKVMDGTEPSLHPEKNLIFMARSLKKGPFVESHLLEKIDKMNNAGARNQLRLSRRSMVKPILSATRFWFTTERFFNLFCDRKHGWSQARRIFADACV